MENAPQVDSPLLKKSTITPLKTLDVILWFLLGIGILFSPLLLGNYSLMLW
jgi:hypothetical protein